jgi:hypothetical protein
MGWKRLMGRAGLLGRHRKERVGSDQAALAVLLCLALAGCAVPREVNPVWIVREVTGLTDRERPPPPGLDQPFPNLASVPPRPEPPPAAVREAITAGLAADRAGAREPLALGAAPGGRGAAAELPGFPPVPARPPPPPALAAAPRVPWTDAPAPPHRPEPVRAVPGQAPPEPLPEPGAEPAPPPPELLAPLPGAAPPPPPPAELLAPPRTR